MLSLLHKPILSTDTDMAKFLHSFDVRISKQFESDIEDFDEAFNAWASSFADRSALRKNLLTTDEGTKSILQGIVHNQTDSIV